MTDFTYQEGTALTWAQMNENLRLMQAKYLDSANSAAIAIAAANFKGNWSALAGALAVPASVYHSSKFWLLLSSLADVTAATPGVSGSWLEIITGNVMGPASATAGSIATLDATGKVLSDGGVAPAALMPKAGGTFTGAVSVPAGATGAQAPQVQEVVKKSGGTMSGVLEAVAGSASAPGVAVSGDANTGIYSPGEDQLCVATGGTLRLSVDSSGNVLSRSGGLGYGVGSGGTASQPGQNGGNQSKSNPVTLNKPSGQITTGNAALGPGASVAFTVTCSAVGASDTMSVSVLNAGGAYRAGVNTGSGTFVVMLTNLTGGSLSDAAAIQYHVHKGATS